MPDLSDLNDDRWMLDMVPQGNQTSVAEPSVVDGLLRAYTKHLLDTTAAVQAGTMTQPQAVEAMKAEAQRMQRIFYGQDKAYAVQPWWNRPEALGAFLCDSAGLGGTPDDAVERLMRAFWNELAPNLSAYQNDEMDEDLFLEGVVGELLERYRAYLMGLPYSPDDGSE